MSTTPNETGTSPLTTTELQQLTEEDLAALRDAVQAEQERRFLAEAIPLEVERLSVQYSGIQGPDAPDWPELAVAVGKIKGRRPPKKNR